MSSPPPSAPIVTKTRSPLALAWARLARPIPTEKRALLEERWEGLPEALRTPWQAVGRHHVQCGGSRRRTGIGFACAHTMTVTERNLGDVSEVIRWLLSDRRHLGVFRMLSLQPEAAVGRTRASGQPATPEAVWREVGKALRRDLPADTGPWFGHPDCSSFVPLLVLYPEGRVIDLGARDPATHRFWAKLLATFGGIGSRGHDHLDANLRRLGTLARHPGMLAEAVRFGHHLKRREGLALGDLLTRLARGRWGFLSLVQHNFIDSADLAEPREPRIEERLAACCLRGAVEQNGEWRAVPMCTLNAGPREALYSDRLSSTR